MKLSFAISVQDTKFKSVAGGNWRDNIDLMARLGFQGIELAIRNPESIDYNDLQSILGKLDLKLVAIATGQVYIDDGLSLSDHQESVRSRALSRLKGLIDLAKIFNCQIIIGLIRGNLGEGNERQLKMDSFYKTNIRIGDGCSNICEIIDIIKDKVILGSIGNRCEKCLKTNKKGVK